MVGRTIGKYHIDEQIGRGGMGTVYKAIDETLDRLVAIKVLNGDVLEQESIERFRREAMTLAKMNHPRIGAIHELTRDGHDLLMVMEFLEGESCEKLIERTAPMSIAQSVRICAQVLDALQYAHGAGVVHRDLKPANIMISPSGDVKVMDFGIARVQGSEHLTTHGFMVGTPAYMSPEQVRGEEVDPRMDLYAVAVVLYRLLTNHLPFPGDTAIAMIHSQLTNQPTPAREYRSDLPEWMVATLARGLSKIAAERFQSAAEFRAALENGLTGKLPAIVTPLIDTDVTLGPMVTPPPFSMPAAPAPVAASSIQPSMPEPVMPTSTTQRGWTGSMPPPPPVPPPQATVTLRAPHVATAGVLVAVLVAGVAILAFVALRQSGSAPAPATQLVEVTPAPAEPVQAPPPVETPAPAPAAASTSAAPVTPAAPAATAPANTTAPAPVTPAPARGSVAAAPADGRRGAAPAVPVTPVTPVTPAAPATPAAADAPAENFGSIRAVVPDGTKGKEVDALLSLEPGNLIVRSRETGAVIRTMPYRNVVAATYARGRRPRGQTKPGAPDVPENFVGGGVFGGARHWLTLQAAGEFLVLRLEDRNIIAVMTSLEARTGLKVERDNRDD